MSPSSLVGDFTHLIEAMNTPLVTPESHISFADDTERNTRVLGDPEKKLVITSLATVECLLAVISSGSQQLEALSAFVVGQQTKLEELQAYYRSLLAPIRRLPTELLQEIFMHAARDPETEGHLGIPSTVSQVSRHWRHVALATPQLWTSIVVLLNAKAAFEQLNHMALWLDRAGSLPLSLTIRTSRSTLSVPQKIHRQMNPIIADWIMLCSPRLESLTFRNDYPEIKSVVRTWQHRLQFNLSILKTICIDYIDNLSEVGDDWFLDLTTLLCEGAPHLERVCLERFIADSSIPLPWSTLKAFRGEISPDHLYVLFFLSGPLELLDVRVVGNLPLFPTGPYHPLKNLTSLVLHTSSFPPSARCFPPLPALRHLRIHHWDRAQDPERVISLLQSWGAELRYLGLPMFEPSFPSCVRRCLALTPKLEALRVPCPSYLRNITSEASLPLKYLTHIETPFPLWADQGDVLEFIHLHASRESFPNLSALTLFTLAYWGSDDLVKIQRPLDDWRLDPGFVVHAIGQDPDSPPNLSTTFDTPYFKKLGLYYRLYDFVA